MVRAAQGLSARGITAATFDFPYISARRKAPDRAPVLEAHWREVLEEGRREFRGLRLFIGGKSMGGRIASQIAAQHVDGLSGLVFFGYPLHPPGRPEQRRDAHLPQIREPMLFIQGSSDPFGNEEELTALVRTLKGADLHVIRGGDHSFKVPGGLKAQQPAFDEVITAAVDWISGKTSQEIRRSGVQEKLKK
jgi:predicted alpha/beta-hydrolase family hydrolase